MDKYWNPPQFGEKKDYEVSVYTVAVGNLTLNPFRMKKQKEALAYIQSLDGFVGLYPHYPDGTLCLFKTENEAKGARNLMKAKGIMCGKNIGEVYIDKKYVKESGDE
jgi:hypothetical protein